VAFLGRNPATAATEIFPEKLANARPIGSQPKGHGKPSKNRSDKSDELDQRFLNGRSIRSGGRFCIDQFIWRHQLDVCAGARS
jgi:hypothetical protein